MMEQTILITGATGNVGAALAEALGEYNEVRVRAGTRRVRSDTEADADTEWVPFDFEDASTWNAALEGVDALFLVRPPQIAAVDEVFSPFIDAAEAAGVSHVAFLSLLGAEKNRFTPHHRIEERLDRSRMKHTALRASIFMQNLNTTHREEIRSGELFIPAGRGRTSFIDVRDIAAVAARAFTDPSLQGQAHDLTGDEALTYDEVAGLFSAVLGRRVVYRRPGVIRFIARWIKKGLPVPFVLIMAGIYSTARLGLAGRVSKDVPRILGRPAITMRQYIEDYRDAWD